MAIREQILTYDKFSPVANSTYKTNIPNMETIAYRFSIPNGKIYKLDTTKRFLMRLTAYESFSGIDTTQDFTVAVSNKVAVVNKDGNVQYDQIAIARGRTSGEVVRCVAYDSSTKELTFGALPTGNVTETVDVFYLIADGQMRFQLTSPSRVVKSSKMVFNSSLSGVNSKNQFNVKDSLYFSGSFEGRAGFSFEFAINSPAQIFFDPADTGISGIGTGWNDIALLELPVLIMEETEAELLTGKNVVEETNKQMKI